MKIYSDEMYPVHSPIDFMGYNDFTEVDLTEDEYKEFCEVMAGFFKVQETIGKKTLAAAEGK